ncbi:ArsR/SmtB family transcription factor [Carnobacterium sp. TMP28]|uniref:ArsR/SmtB family transcription factor n=1 Tax=Carnobacterium sp. TMP28 TaxID=3397060 RepID=UPI0039E01606
MDYEAYAKVMKALSDPKRVKIIDMLSYGALCACDILEQFDFTQPTLSHHIKVLVDSGLVTVEKTGTWHHYSLNEMKMDQLVTETIKMASVKTTAIG